MSRAMYKGVLWPNGVSNQFGALVWHYMIRQQSLYIIYPTVNSNSITPHRTSFMTNLAEIGKEATGKKSFDAPGKKKL